MLLIKYCYPRPLTYTKGDAKDLDWRSNAQKSEQ